MRTFAVGTNGKVALWCQPRPEGKGWVVNGAWLWPDQAKSADKGIVLWDGVVPDSCRDYNEAIAWIQTQVDACTDPKDV